MFGYFKRGERMRSGRKNLTQDLENLPAEALLAQNLMAPDYVEIVCGAKTGDLVNTLAEAFAKLDAIPKWRARIVDQASHPGDESGAEIVSSSLPTADRILVRSEAMVARVVGEAKSRAPIRQPTRRRSASN